MKVWVVIVTYNGKKWLDKCIGNLLRSTIQVEIIVIDNGSIDGTQDHIKKNYPTVNFIQSKENLGFGKANNIGIKKAYDSGAEYVFLLNQDAWVERDTIEKLIVIAKKYPNFGIVSPIHLNGNGDKLDFRFSNYLSPEKCKGFNSDAFLTKLKDKLYDVTFVNAAAWLMSRKCIATIGGFNPLFFMYGEDDNYIQRLKYHELKVGVYPFAIIYHDREQAVKQSCKYEEKQIIKNLLVKYCNPACNISIKEELNWSRRGMLKAVFKLNKVLYDKEYQRYRIVRKIKEDVQYAKHLSQSKGLLFLD